MWKTWWGVAGKDSEVKAVALGREMEGRVGEAVFCLGRWRTGFPR